MIQEWSKHVGLLVYRVREIWFLNFVHLLVLLSETINTNFLIFLYFKMPNTFQCLRLLQSMPHLHYCHQSIVCLYLKQVTSSTLNNSDVSVWLQSRLKFVTLWLVSGQQRHSEFRWLNASTSWSVTQILRTYSLFFLFGSSLSSGIEISSL
jgi:hypothetical protein